MKDRCEIGIGKILLIGICSNCKQPLDQVTKEDFENGNHFNTKDGFPITFDKNEPMCDECRNKLK